MKLKTIFSDIDNVIYITNAERDYSKSIPIKKNIETINKSYNKWYYIILYTARYMGGCNGNISEVKKIRNNV